MGEVEGGEGEGGGGWGVLRAWRKGWRVSGLMMGKEDEIEDG